MAQITFQASAGAIPGGAGAVTLTPVATLTSGPGDIAGAVTTIVVNGTAFPSHFWEAATGTGGAPQATYEIVIRKRT